MILFFDTETTGKADFKKSAAHESQPRLVQLGMIFTDDDGCEISHANLIVKPVMFDIPTEASSIHGIDTQTARAHGVPLLHALLLFSSLARLSQTYVCHNSDFDTFILSGECERMSVDFPKRNAFCTMKAMTDICKIPGPYGNKWPKLAEAYRFCFNKEPELLHDAMADIRLCKDVYFWLKEKNNDSKPK